jgi:aqualysin 1
VQSARRLGRSVSQPLSLLFVALLAGACSDSRLPTEGSPVAPSSSIAVNREANDIIPNSYIVVFDPTLVKDVSSRRSLAAKLLARSGGRQTFIYENLGGYAVENLSAAAAAAIAREVGVAYVEPDRMQHTAAITQPYPSANLDRLDQQYLPLDNGFSYHYSGAGVHVYIVDTGVETNVGEFDGRVGAGYSCATEGGAYASLDDFGHGTAVASVAIGTTFGVAKNATLHSVRISGSTGLGSTSTSRIVCGLDWVEGNAIKPAVVNMSFTGNSNSIWSAIDRITYYEHIPFTKSAGNSAQDAYQVDLANRAQYEWVVGSVNASNDYFSAWFSNYGTGVNMLAPGENVLVADKWNPGSGKLANGTSFAAPHVAGVIAQFLQYDQADPTHPLMNYPWILNDAINNYTTTYGIVQGLTGAASGTPNKMLRSLSWCVPTC